MLTVTKLLISNGAPLNAQNREKKTAFAVALEADNVVILDTLADQIELKDDPKLLHNFRPKIFDERYKQVLVKLLNKQMSEGPSESDLQLMNNLDK